MSEIRWLPLESNPEASGVGTRLFIFSAVWQYNIPVA